MSVPADASQSAQELLTTLRSRTLRIGAAVFAFSIVINLLFLVSPIYMLQIYDRVLSSGSGETLLYLTIAAVGLLAALGALEQCRSHVLVHLANDASTQLDKRLFNGVVTSLNKSAGGNPTQPMRDLDQVTGFLGGQGPISLMDAPWAPFFIGIIFLMHPLLGIVATVGAILLAVLAILTEAVTRTPAKDAHASKAQSMQFMERIMRNAPVIDSMGMAGNLMDRWLTPQRKGADAMASANERSATVRAVIKFLRPSIQAAMLGTGAFLALRGEITPGVIVAASIISGRALAPVEQAVGSWKQIVGTREAYSRLKAFLLRYCDKPAESVVLPRPTGALTVEKLVGGPPETRSVVIKNVSFQLEPGQFLGVAGPSGAGKTTLANMLIGIWRPMNGCVRLDGADVTAWDKSNLGPAIGYLPQDTELFEGTVAQNIARFGELDSEAVLEAAHLAGVHDFILRLEKGYETQIGPGGVFMSAGQRQRIALARAIYNRPAFLVLDEPNSYLDAAGEAALIQTLKNVHERGTTIVLICHRPQLLALADTLMILRDGQVQAIGPSKEVIKRMTGPAPSERPEPEQREASAPPKRDETNPQSDKVRTV